MPRPHICHVTSVHIPLDGRIFFHECVSASEFYDVTLVCRDDGPERDRDGVRILPAASRLGGRVGRIRSRAALVRAAEALGADVYHFHDPELLGPMAALRRRTGRPVVYDMHEHYPLTVRLRSWIPRPFRPLAAWLVERFERHYVPRFDGLVVADDMLLAAWDAGGRQVVCLRNYPPLRLFKPATRTADRRPTMIYVGSISRARGFDDMIEAARQVCRAVPNCRLVLVGTPTEDAGERLVRIAEEEPDLIEVRGPVPYDQLPAVLAEADVGLSLLSDHDKYRVNVPTKVFDYMAAGIPYVSSDFPPLRSITGGVGGSLVLPGDTVAAASAIAEFLLDPDRAKSIGSQGRRAVEERINWESQHGALQSLYQALLG